MKWWWNNARRPASGRSLSGAPRAGLFGLLALALLARNPRSLGAAELQTATEVRTLSAAAAAEHQPVHLRGVVTFFDETLFSRFIQDDTAGIYLRDGTNTPALQPGQFVEVRGVTSPGEYAPIVVPEQVEILGNRDLPSAKLVSFQQLASGQEDSQFVEIEGIVRDARYDKPSGYHVLELASGGGRLTVYARQLPADRTEALVDSTLRVRGVCSTQFNRQRQLFAIRLMVPRAADLVIDKPAAGDPFAVASRSLGSLLQFAPQGSYGHRVKITATVTHHQPGQALYVQDEHYGLFIQTRQTTPLRPGDRVEVLGFPAQGQYTPVLQDAVYRRVAAGIIPPPVRVDHTEVLQGALDCRLVRLEAKLLDRARHSREQFLVLEAGDFIFHATLERETSADAFAGLENGSLLAVTGICLIDPGNWQAGENWRARSFQLLLRSPDDVLVLLAPPWWTLRKLLWMVGLLILVALGAIGWVVLLRGRVAEQTGIIRRQLQVEAGLKERYVDLFENANDMVFTHDLTGRITSINQAGERMLQRPRREILEHNLTSLVTGDQRPAAGQWLDAIARGAAPPTAEWDFLNSAGQLVKLEISTRLITQNGKPAEVEGIARDVTERRTLEREVLEISNREQRRIGHDLHDGVCQQLAAIAYRVDMLGDKLREQGVPEAGETERIGGLLNEATLQARNVARGLFPVRLEENGLVSALEELATNTESRFAIRCRFASPAPAVKVDNAAALHLYFIAQEAVLNAARHGKATQVDVALQWQANRLTLQVVDDGTGFAPPDSNPTGMGIRIMRYRAQVIGATLDLRSAPGHGAKITCELFPATKELPPFTSHD